MAVDPGSAQPTAWWIQYAPHGSLITLALLIGKWGRGWARKWERRVKSVEEASASKANVAELADIRAAIETKATIAELNVYQRSVEKKFSELGATLERHVDNVTGRFERQDNISEQRFKEVFALIRNASDDSIERLDRLMFELMRQGGVGRKP